MKKILSILCAFSLILGIGSFNLSASADGTNTSSINFVKFRVAQQYTSEDGKTGVRFYKESNGAYEMFVAKTDYELKADTRYLISMYYKSAVKKLQPTIAAMENETIEGFDGNNVIGYSLAAMPTEAYSEWRKVSFTVDTTGKVDAANKYLSFAAKGWDGADTIDYAICDITVDEIDDSFEFAFSTNGNFGYIDDGERQYADYTCPATSYNLISFGAKINAEPATEYMLMFDYKKAGSFKEGTSQFTIDGTKVADFVASDTSEWQTYAVKIKTPDVINEQFIKFNASTLQGKASFSFDNFRLAKLNSSCIYPKHLKDMAYYTTDTDEYGWKFSTKGSTYITAGFAFDYELEANSNYLIEYDYINPVGQWWSEPLNFGVTDSNGTNSGAVVELIKNTQIAALSVQVTDKWTPTMAVINTGDKVDGDIKHLGVYGKFAGGALPQIAFKNFRITKLDSSALYPTYLKDMVQYKTEDGEIAWKFSTTATEYVLTGFSTGYVLEPNKIYAVNFDYNQTVSSWNLGLSFAAGKTDFDFNRFQSCRLASLGLGVTEVWNNKTVIIKTDEYSVYEDNNILWVYGQTAGLPDVHFKNLTVTELGSSSAIPNYEDQFEYFINDDGELEWNFSKTSSAGEYSRIGFSTDITLKKDKGYVAVFDYKYATKGWLNNGIEISAVGSSALVEPGKGKVVLNDQDYTGDEWKTLKTAYIASDVTDTNKYFGLVGKTNEKTSYDISFKNIRLYDLGDVDFDGEINSTDLAVLKKELLGIKGEAQFADVNNDGETNILDLISLKKLSVK